VILGGVTINATGGGAALTNSGSVQLEAVNVNGALSVAGTGNIAQGASPIVVAAGYGSTIAAAGGSVTLTNATNDFGDTLALSGTGGTIVGMISGTPTAAGVTAVAGTFSVNGSTVSSTPTSSPSTASTAAVFSEISSVAPIDQVLRVDAPPGVGSGVTAPAIGFALNLGPADLGGAPVGGPGTESSAGASDEGAGPLLVSPAAAAGPTAGALPSTDTPTPAGGPGAPQIVLSGATPPLGAAAPSVGGVVRATPGTPVGGPVTLIQGVLVQGGIAGSAPAPTGSSNVSRPFPQQGNSTLW
jgi:hypothetical protein